MNVESFGIGLQSDVCSSSSSSATELLNIRDGSADLCFRFGIVAWRAPSWALCLGNNGYGEQNYGNE